MRKSFHDMPVFDLSLRRFEKPSGSFKDLLRKFCISVGLLQPGDSRDVIVDLLELFIKAAKEKKFLSTENIYSYVLRTNKKGVSQSNTRRHLFRLKEMDFIEKTSQGYRLREWLSLKELFSDLVKFKINPTISRIIEYASLIDGV
jgi:DNA-binding transcriptional ArsR family regulator